MRYDHLIIGGGIAGASAAEEIRRRDAGATVAIIAEEKHPIYSRVLLPHVADRRATKDRAILKTEADFRAKNIVYLSGSVATAIDVPAKTVTMADGTALEYGKLLIATGTVARRFPGPGAEHFIGFRVLEDLDAFERATAADRVLVYGGGFNAIDLAASFVRRGIPCVGAMRGDGYLARVVDARGSAMINAELAAQGLAIRPRTEVIAVEKRGERDYEVFFAGGGSERFGAVAASLGVAPNVTLLSGTGLATRTGVLTDEYLRVQGGNGDVFAAGDVAEYLDVHLGGHRIAGNWQNSMFQGRTAGANMVGAETRFDMVTSYSIPCFGLPVNVTGAVGAEETLTRIVRKTVGGASLQFVLARNRVVGATIVGPFPERVALGALISSHKALSAKAQEMLADGTAKLENLL